MLGDDGYRVDCQDFPSSGQSRHEGPHPWGGGQRRHDPDSMGDKVAYTQAEFIAYYGAARGEAEWRAAVLQLWGGRPVPL